MSEPNLRVARLAQKALQQRSLTGTSPTLDLFASSDLLPPEAEESSRLLPQWGDHSRGIPNVLLGSGLFAAISPNQRRYLKSELIAAEGNIEIRFTGMQLDQTDRSLWETLVHIARHTPMGGKFYFKPAQVLPYLNLSRGGEQFDWLKSALERMVACSVSISFDGKISYSSNLLKVWTNEITGERAVILDKELFTLYNHGWSEINWQQRNALRRKPLALWLHSWHSCPGTPTETTAEEIHRRCGSNAKSMTSFRACIRTAYQDLVKEGALADFAMTKSGHISITLPNAQKARLPGF